MFTPDFTISISNEKLKVLLITDIQIIDASKSRTEDRLAPIEKIQWATDTINKNCFDIIRQLVHKTNPDLILSCGDFVYGEFDDTGDVFKKTIDFFDTLGVKYATCLGNHERDSNLPVETITDIISNGKNSLFKMGNVSGAGNFTIGIYNESTLVRLICITDSHPNKIGFSQDQIDWLFSILNSDEIKEKVPVTLVYHEQMNIMEKALEKYGFPNINYEITNSDTDFGYVGAQLKNPWDMDFSLFGRLSKTTIDTHFFGHEHCNSASVVIDNIRMHYVLKSSTYDRCNYKQDNGEIIPSYVIYENPIIGGSYFELDSNGKISALKHVFYEKNT